jgi:hypothetical protein
MFLTGEPGDGFSVRADLPVDKRFLFMTGSESAEGQCARWQGLHRGGNEKAVRIR